MNTTVSEWSGKVIVTAIAVHYYSEPYSQFRGEDVNSVETSGTDYRDVHYTSW